MTDAERAFMKDVAASALKHQINTVEAQRVFGILGNLGAQGIVKHDPSQKASDVIRRYVAAYCSGIGVAALEVVTATPTAGGTTH
jgi:hypothetical protein